MKFTVKERLLLVNTVLPREGDYLTLKILRQLREDLSFSDEENEILEFKKRSSPGVTEWDETKDPRKDVKVCAVGEKIIKDSLTMLESQKRLPIECMELYERFILNVEEKKEVG